ncbi:MAG: hypothetical protein AAF152_16810 [Cyanobacteria bacterium P01_A01_bin.114]
MIPSLPPDTEHPWPSGHLFQSPGGHLTYRVVGPCCRLFDREQLPWPCCRIQWRGKEPSWRRIGRRLISDLATRKHPSYSVEIVGQGYRDEPFVTTLYIVKLDAELQGWWHTKQLTPADLKTLESPSVSLAETRPYPCPHPSESAAKRLATATAAE